MNPPLPPRTSLSHHVQITRAAPPETDWYPVYISEPVDPPYRSAGPYRRRRRWYRRPGFWLGMVLIVVLVMLTVAAAVAYAVTNIPLPSELDTSPTIVLDKNGDEIGQLHAESTREDVVLSDVPEHTVNAVLAAEDAGFYEHQGVSIPGIVRAAVADLRSGEVRQGGSTISQQYVKTVTGDADQTVMRKAREAVLAMKLEREVSKDQILEYYLNTIYFGRGAYGIQAAARAYFNKDVGDLTVGESALLAGFIPAPSLSDPVDHPERAAARFEYVVGQMLERGWVTNDRAGKLLARQPEVTPKAKRRAQAAPFFMAMVEEELARRLGGDEAYRGLTVKTTLNPRIQRIAEKTYKSHFSELREGLDEGVNVPTGAMASLDPKTGAIRALVGGRNFANDEYNLATGGPKGLGRQPGSTFKPFALAAWIADGKSPESYFEAPAGMEFSPDETGGPEPWEVSNYGDAGYGRMTLREATWKSVNTVYAQLALDVGPDEIADLAQEMGIASSLEPNASIVLGAEEVTPLELASAYNTLCSGGVSRAPRTIESVSRDDEVLYEPRERARRVLDEDVAWTTVDVLRGVIQNGTGVAAQIGRPAMGKTGTTQEAADAWFAGCAPNLTTVTWMGYRDSNEAMPGSPTGGGFPAELWADYMRRALEKTPEMDFPEPSGDYEVVGEPAPEPSVPAEEPEPSAEPEPSEPASDEPSLEEQLKDELERQQRELEDALEDAREELDRQDDEGEEQPRRDEDERETEDEEESQPPVEPDEEAPG